MEDFFKQFRQNLEHRPEPGFEEQDWQDLQKRLDRKDKKPPPLLIWWLGLPLMLLIGANIWLFQAMQKASRQTAALEIRRDTIVQTRVVYITDTIYRTRVLRERIVEYLPARSAKRTEPVAGRPAGPLAEPRFSVDHPPEKRDLPIARQEAGRDSILLPIVLKNEQVAESQHMEKKMDRLYLPDHYLAGRSPASPLRAILIPATKQKKTIRHHLYTMRPKGFQAGITGGWAYPFSKDLHQQRGSSVGVQAAVAFSPSLELWADALYFNLRYETNRMGDDIGVPTVAPPSDDLTFIKAELPQPSLQYSLGMSYLFRPGRPLRPCIGLGYGVVSLLPYEIIYDFEDKALGIEWIYEKQVERSGLLTGFGLLRLGADYQLSRRWNAQLRATYRSHLYNIPSQSPRLLGLQGGINYRF